MTKRRDFIIKSGTFAAGTILLPSFTSYKNSKKIGDLGVQLYTFRDEMEINPKETLKKIASLGIKQIESAKSDKGLYYGLGPKEMKDICKDLGMTLRSGHVHVDKDWDRTLAEATESGQEYLICSSMPSKGQTVDNYKAVAEIFNKAGEDCKKVGIKFGYHNHEYEFEKENNQVLYDVLLDNTQIDLVQMELDLGWVVVSGNDPLDYFKKYPGRFPLWHLKDMSIAEKKSTEFGKGDVDILSMLQNRKESGLKYIFIEQEEYSSSPFESMKENMQYLDLLKI